MMTTMFGFLPEEASALGRCVRLASARASNTFMVAPSEPQVRRRCPGLIAAVSATACATGCPAASAPADGVMPFVAAMKPSTAPSATHASD